MTKATRQFQENFGNFMRALKILGKYVEASFRHEAPIQASAPPRNRRAEDN